jgi:hypothetical protein
MSDEVLTAARLLFTPGQVVEVRAITDDGMASGYFDSPEELAGKVEALDGMPAVQGIYVTLNQVNPALLARRANRIKMRLGKKDATTADADILSRQWFPVDIDPCRPSGVSSTDDEHQAAIVRAAEISAYLGRERGWPAPVLADSGNGAHLLYRIDLPNDDRSRDLVKRCLLVLAALFGDQVADVDTANHNAARIWKLYGTMSRKGDHTDSRPHRRSAILDAPEKLHPVSVDLLTRLASALPDEPAIPAHTKTPGRSKGNSGKPIDLREWLNDHRVGVKVEKPYQGGTLFILDECPFSGGHKDGAFAIQFPSGGIYAGCHHASCGAGQQRWQDLRDRYEKRGNTTQRAEKKQTGPLRPPGGIPPTPAAADLPGRDEALTVLEHGDPKRAMIRTFALDHEGDETVAECLIMSLASRSVINTNGLHVSVTGESGKGKSHAFTTMLRQVPERFRLSGAMSNKALFYIDDLQPGMSIVLDDTALSEDMAEILKGVTTSFRKPFMYRTVNKDRKGQICTIPERCIWWVAKVEGSGDDQVFNRMLTCWIDDSPEQDERVLARILHQNTILPERGNDESEEVMMCRAMWEILGQKRIHVIIPFANRIRFQAAENRRNPDMLLDLVKANALIWFMQRDRPDAADLHCITATREDFTEAARLYGRLNGTTGGQTTKLTKRESDLVDTIAGKAWVEFTIPMLQTATGLSNGAIHKLLHGYASRGSAYSGLLEKCPAIAYTDRTVVTDDTESGASTRRRTNAYTLDQEIFRSWCSGGAVWIEEEAESDDEDENYPSTTSASFCNTSTRVEGQKNDTMNADSLSKDNNTHMCVYKDVSFRNCESIECGETAPVTASHSLCERGSAEGQKSISDKSPPIDTNETETARNTYLHMQKDAVGQPGFTDVAEGQEKVRAADYKRLDLPDSRAKCHSCGKKGVAYIEKFTPGREKRKKDPARRICRRCYDAAVRRDRAAAPPLPGVISLTGLKRISKEIGRCTVCQLGVAVYSDTDAGVKLCEACYSREQRQQAEGRAGS